MLDWAPLLGRILPVVATTVVLPMGQTRAQSSASEGQSAAAPAAGETKDKNVYNLFHPTPPDLMRELSTDRPDKTESPYTVDAGHVQIEMDLASYSYDRHNPEHEARRV